jgi:hypothetical protein
MKNKQSTCILILLCLFISVFPALSQVQETFTPPPELWEQFQKTLQGLEVNIIKDEIINSYSDPDIKLRRIEFTFFSQEFYEKKWIHPCIFLLPVDSREYLAPDRRGKVVLVAHPGGDEIEPFLLNFGDPIVTSTGYPTMVFQNPGKDTECDFRYMVEKERNKLIQGPIDHNYFRMAVPYLRALDIMADFMQIDKNEIRAVIGGHSKRATGAYNAAAIDSVRIKGIVYMGNESVWGITDGYPSVCPGRIKDWISAEVLYLGASNEAYRPGKWEYHMYNINKIQEMMGGAWTIEYIPNYIHWTFTEKHFLGWQMWVGHVFEDRPVAKISDLTYEKDGFGTKFRARIESDSKIIHVMLWNVYTGYVPPYWRDLLWRPSLMVKRDDGIYEGFVSGDLPDAWIIEVKDIAHGFPGYVSSLPQDITGKRNWHVGD